MKVEEYTTVLISKFKDPKDLKTSDDNTSRINNWCLQSYIGNSAVFFCIPVLRSIPIQGLLKNI